MNKESSDGRPWYVQVVAKTEPVIGSMSSARLSWRASLSDEPKVKHYDQITGSVTTLMLKAPVEMLNLICQPLLYRVVDGSGFVCAEGVIPSFGNINIHRIDLEGAQYLSIRMLNYCWSSWKLLYSTKAQFQGTERIELSPMTVRIQEQQDRKVQLPVQVLTLSAEGHSFTISCLLWVNNRTALPIEIREAPTVKIDISDVETLPQSSDSTILSLFDNEVVDTDTSPAIPLATETAGPASPISKFPARPQSAPDFREIDSDEGLSVLYKDTSPPRPGAIDKKANRPHNSNVTKGSVKSFKNRSSGALVSMTVYLPTNHFRTVELTVSARYTLAELLDMLFRNDHLPEYLKNERLHFVVVDGPDPKPTCMDERPGQTDDRKMLDLIRDTLSDKEISNVSSVKRTTQQLAFWIAR
jgi:hypothetical protein